MPRMTRCATGWMRLGLLSLSILTSACAAPVASGTDAAVCRELRRALPSWSRQDTEQSREEGARFIAVFEAACPP